jgi:hypothetical protein
VVVKEYRVLKDFKESKESRAFKEYQDHPTIPEGFTVVQPLTLSLTTYLVTEIATTGQTQ